MPLKVSRNEVETLCYRAALGVGLPQGLAEDAAWIGAGLACTRPDGLAIMLRALASVEAHPVVAPVFRREGGAWRANQAFVPALVSGPVAADLRRAEPGVEVVIGETGEPDITAICLSPGEIPPHQPFVAEDGVWRELGRLAARTYVPASDTSRLMGAGAGLLDND